MKLFEYLFVLSVAAFMGLSCDKISGDDYDPSNAKRVFIRPSNSILVANGKDRMYFSVIADGHDVTHLATFYQVIEEKVGDNEYVEYDEEMSVNYFSTEAEGTYKFWATVEGVLQDKIQVVEIQAMHIELPEAPADPQNKTTFAHRTLITKFTGTACPNCPKVIEAMEMLENDADYAGKYVAGACHSYGKGSVIATDSPLPTSFSVSSYPTVWVGNKAGLSPADASSCFTWLKRNVDEMMATPAKVGIAVNSEFFKGKDGDVLMVTAQIKANQSGDYYLGCWLVEDNLKAPQAGVEEDTIIHNDVIRVDANKVMGGNYDYRGKIFQNMIVNSPVEENYKLEFQSSWTKENCRLIFFATAKDADGKWSVTNAISAKVGTSKPYEYIN